MPIEKVQLYDQCISVLAKESVGGQWDEIGSYYFILVGSGYTPDDTHTTLANIGAGDTEANASGTSKYINAGDGAPIAMAGSAVTETAGNTDFNSNNADFGASVMITGVKYLVLVKGTAATPNATDKLMLRSDLKTEGGEVAATATPFNVLAPANGWFSIGVQA